jgi:hypothetical protein
MYQLATAIPDPKMGGWARLTHNDQISIFVQMQRRAGNMIPSLPLNKGLCQGPLVVTNCQSAPEHVLLPVRSH